MGGGGLVELGLTLSKNPLKCLCKGLSSIFKGRSDSGGLGFYECSLNIYDFALEKPVLEYLRWDTLILNVLMQIISCAKLKFSSQNQKIRKKLKISF